MDSEHWSKLSIWICNSKFQNYHIKRESYMNGVLNLDEIKDELPSLFVNYKTNLMSLINLILQICKDSILKKNPHATKQEK